MANRIRPLRRTGSTGVPNVSDMLDGEIAVNSFDKKIWMKVGSNLVEVANASSGGGGGLYGGIIDGGNATTIYAGVPAFDFGSAT